MSEHVEPSSESNDQRQEGYIASEWGVSDNNRKARYYRLTRAGGKQLEKAARQWEQTTEIMARFLAPGGRRS
jgi:PadR family transcriptional regulator, regulatory protein PadR